MKMKMILVLTNHFQLLQHPIQLLSLFEICSWQSSCCPHTAINTNQIKILWYKQQEMPRDFR